MSRSSSSGLSEFAQNDASATIGQDKRDADEASAWAGAGEQDSDDEFCKYFVTSCKDVEPPAKRHKTADGEVEIGSDLSYPGFDGAPTEKRIAKMKIYARWHKNERAFRQVQVQWIDDETEFGLVSTADVEKNAEVFTDMPMVSMQTTYSKALAPVCFNCHETIGTLRANIDRCYLKKQKPPFSKMFDTFIDCVDEVLRPQKVGQLTCPCCSEIFCSASCLKHHACIKRGKFWRRYVQLATANIEAGEQLILLAHAISNITRVDAAELSEQTILERLREYLVFYSKPWEELARDDSGRAKRVQMLNDAALLLPLVFFGENPVVQKFQVLFRKKTFSMILGAMSLTNVDICYDCPYNALLQRTLDKIPQDGIDVLESLQEYTKDESEWFPQFYGTGLYRTASMCNHSCSPNIEISSHENNRIIATSTRGIKKGEELTISYIDQSQTLKQRREELLKRYGFHCRCDKCRLEEFITAPPAVYSGIELRLGRQKVANNVHKFTEDLNCNVGGKPFTVETVESLLAELSQDDVDRDDVE
jgi:hypothetical protein